MPPKLAAVSFTLLSFLSQPPGHCQPFASRALPPLFRRAPLAAKTLHSKFLVEPEESETPSYTHFADKNPVSSPHADFGPNLMSVSERNGARKSGNIGAY